MVWLIVILLLVAWAVGFSLHVAGSMIHALLIFAFVLLFTTCSPAASWPESSRDKVARAPSRGPQVVRGFTPGATQPPNRSAGFSR